VSSLERAEVLPADLKRKIERYIFLWQEESRGEWPLLSSLQKGDSGKPSLRERLFDRALYRWIRMYDAIAVCTNCFAPYELLRRYRSHKKRVVGRNPAGSFWLG
jgi:hypothetical protein